MVLLSWCGAAHTPPAQLPRQSPGAGEQAGDKPSESVLGNRLLRQTLCGPCPGAPGTSQSLPTVSEQLPTDLAAQRSLSPNLTAGASSRPGAWACAEAMAGKQSIPPAEASACWAESLGDSSQHLHCTLGGDARPGRQQAGLAVPSTQPSCTDGPCALTAGFDPKGAAPHCHHPQTLWHRSTPQGGQRAQSERRR